VQGRESSVALQFLAQETGSLSLVTGWRICIFSLSSLRVRASPISANCQNVNSHLVILEVHVVCRKLFSAHHQSLHANYNVSATAIFSVKEQSVQSCLQNGFLLSNAILVSYMSDAANEIVSLALPCLLQNDSVVRS
jgi:hypothetical protein